jgi:hypothetical protein
MSEPNDWLMSDEVRELTRAGSSFMQATILKELGIPFELDRYETPMVRRSVAEEYKQRMLAVESNKLN